MEKTNKVVRIILLAIWCLLICFTVIWFIEPQWLKDISHQGKIVESTENKLKGDELLRQQNFADAYSAYDHALQIRGDMQSAAIGKAIAAEKLNKNNEALNILNSLLDRGADKPWEIYYTLSTIYEKQRDKEKTISSLEKCIEFSPEPFSATMRLARIYFTSSEWKKALVLYNKALDFKPDIKNGYLSTLQTERHTYKLDDEMTSAIDKYIEYGWSKSTENLYYENPYEKALNSNPAMARLFNDIGFCYAMLEDIPASIPYFQQAVKIQPKNKEYQQNLGKAKHEVGIGA